MSWQNDLPSLRLVERILLHNLSGHSLVMLRQWSCHDKICFYSYDPLKQTSKAIASKVILKNLPINCLVMAKVFQ